jgi:hypothetical protein
MHHDFNATRRMFMKIKYLVIGLLLLVAALALAACGTATPEPTQAPPPQPTQACPEVPACPECPTCPEPVVDQVPFQDAWANSPHNDVTAEAFNHWNEDDPAEVPTSCAKCHSTPGYEDFLGADGSEFGVVDQAAPIGTTIQCIACHNDVAVNLTSVVFPSGIEISNLGPQARCMECHQGRASTTQVNDAIGEAGKTEDLDTVSEDLSFINIHYFAAAATRLGTEAKGGYEYAEKAYDPRFDHVAGYDTCLGCHDQHTLQVKVDQCSVCHTNVSTLEDLKNVRMNGSLVDYDGDGDITEGIYYEVEGLRDLLYQAIQAYATEVSGTPIVYDAGSYPYFFADANANGSVDEGDEAYNAWTARLVKAAYNYQTSLKDPGAFAHGGKYIIELLYDSTEDLNTALSTPVDLSNAHRIDAGHFAASQEAFRHWDEEGEVPGSCSRCHSAAGLPLYIQEGVSINQPVASGLNCATCHNDLTTFTRFEVGAVTFPSGASLDSGSSDANLCLNCHQGRESTVSLNAAINQAGVGDDEVSDALRFRNPHYFAAGATRFGTEAKGAYEYADQTYNGIFKHVDAFSLCTQCHDTHGLTVRVEACGVCHSGVQTEADLKNIRVDSAGQAIDYDGDGNTTEGIAGEVQGMHDALYAAIQTYATDTVGAGIVYDNGSYPYWFTDTNGNGTGDPDEINSDNAYASWTPRLLRATYNYTWVAKDPGAFAHNNEYVMQFLYDSIQDLGGDVSAMTRPPVTSSSE